MTTTLKYVGKKSEFVGKTLWEILGNLKDGGVGRIVVRNSHVTKFKEPCYYRILEVRAQPNEVPPKIKVNRPPNDLRDRDRPRRVEVVCEYIFRGVKFDQPRTVLYESGLPDFSLVPKHLEKNYTFTKTSSQRIEENIVPRYSEFPPLLKDILIKSGVKDPKLITQQVKNYPNALYRVAKEGEKPTKDFDAGFGTPRSPNLYKGVNYDI